LSIEQNTHFQENVSPFVPVFVDNDSYLNLNVDNTGELNTGMTCTKGIFLENDNSYCLAGGKCKYPSWYQIVSNNLQVMENAVHSGMNHAIVTSHPKKKKNKRCKLVHQKMILRLHPLVQ